MKWEAGLPRKVKESAITPNCDGWACCDNRVVYHNSLRFRLLILLCLYPGLANADLTGIAVKIGDSESDWKFDSGVRNARGTELSFRVEEKVESGLEPRGLACYRPTRRAP